MRAGAVLAVLALAACVDTGAASQPSVTVVEQCSAESGFTARAAAAHASGVNGDIPGTPKELAAINACVKAKVAGLQGVGGRPMSVETQSSGARPVASARKAAASPVPTGRGTCRNTMVGGDGYACVPI